MDLPSFRFHPDPVRSGSIEASTTKCRCCRRKRDWIYTGRVYAEEDLEDSLCPWCIAEGKAHEKFDALFVDPEAFDENVPAGAADEISQRTPGFASWQSERWPSCCGEAGTFVGPAGIAEIRTHFPTMEGDLMGYIVHDLHISGGAARQMLDSLHRDQSPTAYVFRCLKCERHFGHVDYL